MLKYILELLKQEQQQQPTFLGLQNYVHHY